MRTADYWAERFTALDDSIYKTSEKYARSLQTQFDRAKRTISRDLGYWYGRLAENNGISYAEAKKLLKDDELSEFKMTVAEYIKHGKEDGLDPEWIKRLENVSAKVHISRLEQIQTDLQQTVEGLYKSYETGAGELLQSVTMTSYYHTAYEVAKGTGIGVNLHRLDIDTVAGFLSRPWCQDGKVFSDRIWTRKDELVDSLNTLLAQNLMTGADPQKAIDELAKRFDVEKRAAGRLIMTETAAIQNEARQKCMKDLDVEEFEFVATLDSHTSTLCRGMDGQHFPMSQFKIGLNAPPLHCNCRSTTVPWFDDEFTEDETRAARETEDVGYKQVPSNMTYKEWEDEYISSKKRSDLPMAAKGGKINVEDVNIPRSDAIANFTSTQEIREFFPEITIEESFERMSLESQKEAAQGLEYMRQTFGADAMPRRIAAASQMKDYASVSTTTKKMTFRTNLEPGVALVASCYESVHLLDAQKGNVAESVMRQAYKRLGVRFGSKQSDYLLFNSIGSENYIEYRKDYDEQLAWCYESSLYSKNDLLGNMVRIILTERFGN